MRKRLGLVLLASLTLSSVLLVAGPSAAAAIPSPKGKVYIGIETVDPDLSPNVITIGQGSNPVPMILIDYNAGNCRAPNDNRLPVILSGLVDVSAADGDGMRTVSSHGPINMQCTRDKTIWQIDLTLEYDSTTDQMLGGGDWAVEMDRTCNGQPVPGINTIIGTAGANTLVGTAGMDIIDGRGGNDTLRGAGGHDILCGANGADKLYGGGGYDLLVGGAGRDGLFGGDGMDALLGGANKGTLRETLNGGASWDVIFGWIGKDKLLGVAGNDVLFGGPSADILNGGKNKDACYDVANSVFKSCETKARTPAALVRIGGPQNPDTGEMQALIAELEAFAAGKSLDFEYEQVLDFGEAFDSGDPPDILISPGPVSVIEFSDQLVNLNTFFPNNQTLRNSFGDYLISLVSVGNKAFGGPIRAIVKSIVWYQPASFADAGYAVPTSYAELVALSDQMVADGKTPWCTYLESGPASGWLGTDWIEDLLLGAKGGDFYDDWVAHSVLFAHSAVDKAFDRFVEMIDTAGYVHDRANMLNVGFWENVAPLLDGDCMMHKQGSFLGGVVGDTSELGTFHFPAANATHSDAVMGSGDFVTATSEQSWVGDFVRFMLRPNFGKAALVDFQGWVMPHVNFNTSLYTDDVTREWADQLKAAISSDLFRFDASDLMPADIGAIVDGGPGAFWVGVQDLVNGSKTVPQVLQWLDNQWPM